MTTFTAEHIHSMGIAASTDDKSYWLHAVLGKIDPETYAVIETPGTQLEYVSKDGDVFSMFAIHFGYLIEVPKRPGLSLIEWMQEETGKIIPPDEYFIDDIRPEDISIAGVGMREDGEYIVWIESIARPHARYLWTDDALTHALMNHDLTGMNHTVRGVVVNDPETFIKKKLPCLKKADLVINGITITMYAKPDIIPFLEWN